MSQLLNNFEEVIFFDDFLDSELDRTEWNVGIKRKIFNKEQQTYID